MSKSGIVSKARFASAAGALAGLLCLSPGIALAADNTTPPGNQWSGWDPGTVVEIKLERGRILEPLPFDVPFFILTKPPQPVLPKFSPLAFLAQTPRSAGCEEKPPTSAFCGSYPTALCKVPVVKVKEKVDKTGDAVEQIEISMPQLEPKKDYCLLVAIPREATPAEKTVMKDAAKAFLERAVKAANRREVLSADWLATQCQDLKAAMEDALRAEEGLVLIPGEDSMLRDCEKAAVEDLYEKLVSDTSLENLDTSRKDAEAVLAALKSAIPDDESDPRLKAIRDLDNPGDRFGYLGLPPKLPNLVSKELVEKWTEAAKTRRDELVKGWATKAADLSTICNDGAKTLAAPPLTRMRCFTIDQLETVLSDLQFVADNLAAGDDVEKLAATAAPELVDNVAVGATTSATFEQRFRWYVSADMGFAHAWDVDKSFAYTGVNFYGSPVNKRAPLSTLGRKRFFSQRLALVLGIPASNVDDPSWEPIVAGKPVLVGAGLRLTDYLRITAGGLVFDEVDPDPLVNRTRGLKATPFVSLSLDIDVAGIFMGFFAAR